jgi:hypothetical protein
MNGIRMRATIAAGVLALALMSPAAALAGGAAGGVVGS